MIHQITGLLLFCFLESDRQDIANRLGCFSLQKKKKMSSLSQRAQASEAKKSGALRFSKSALMVVERGSVSLEKRNVPPLI